MVAVAVIIILATGAANAEPGLWIAKGPQATIYLFGTVHVLRKNQNWASPAITRALADSGELWLEVPDPDNSNAAQALVAQLGFDRQRPLSGKLAASDLAHLDAAAKAAGVAEGEIAFEPTRPWLASVMLEQAIIVHAGYEPDSGVERQLLRDASITGKRIRGFETLDQQMHFFADMSPALEVDLLRNTLQDFDQGAIKLNKLVDAWLRGDEETIAQIMVDDIKRPFPALYRTILVQRNEAWAAALATMLKGSGVKFVAVGAAHLAGTDSVQIALEHRGIHVERINLAR